MEIEFRYVAVCVDVLNDPILLRGRNTRRAAPIAGKRCYYGPAGREQKTEREGREEREAASVLSAPSSQQYNR